jgi:hypothetical protein
MITDTKKLVLLTDPSKKSIQKISNNQIGNNHQFKIVFPNKLNLIIVRLIDSFKSEQKEKLSDFNELERVQISALKKVVSSFGRSLSHQSSVLSRQDSARSARQRSVLSSDDDEFGLAAVCDMRNLKKLMNQVLDDLTSSCDQLQDNLMMLEIQRKEAVMVSGMIIG